MFKRLLSAAWRSARRTRDSEAQQAETSVFVQQALAAQQAGNLQEARRSYERAIELGPQAPELRMNYAAVLKQLGEYARATHVYEQIFDERPDWAAPYLACGMIAFEQVEWDKAFSLLERAVTLTPDIAHPRVLSAIVALELGHMNRAIEHCETALRMEPGNALAARTLRAVCYRLGDIDRLKSVLQTHSTPETADGAAIAAALALPSILDSREDIARVRARLSEDIERLAQRELHVRDPASDVAATAFYLAYHGEDDRPLQERIAALHLKACPELGYAAPHCLAAPPRTRDRINVGIVSNYLYGHSIGRVLRGLIARLDRRRFCVRLYTAQLVVDTTSRALQSLADEWVVLPRNLAQAREALAHATLDVVLYPDIGMDPFTYFLAFARLAPVQCTTWGHPVTTGIPALDYFVSTDYFEPEHAERHYSERLIRLADVTFPGYYERPAMPPPAPPAALGFDRGRRVYFCPHALFKFHPDVDPVFADILRRDPGGEIVIVHDNERDTLRLAHLQARLRRAVGDVYERIAFVPHTPTRDGYLQRLQACDVVLDTIHYGGGNTSLEAISAGALVVTLPSQFNRGRHTYGFFRKMRFMKTVVQTPEAYVDLAVRIATDSEFRASLKAEQEVHAHALYEDQGAVDQIEAFFEQALESARRG